MWNPFYRLIMPIVLLALTLFACSKVEQRNEDGISGKNKFILNAQEWYQKIYNSAEKLNWDSAIVFDKENYKSVMVPFPFSRGFSNGSRSIRRIIVTKKSTGFEGEILIILPTRAYASSHKGYNSTDFSGLVGTYDLNMKYKSGTYFEKGQAKHPADFKSYESKLAYQQEVKTERQCTLYQDTYVDDNGIFTVYGYSVCVDDIGNQWTPGGGGSTSTGTQPDGGGGGGTPGGGQPGNGVDQWDPEKPVTQTPLPPTMDEIIKVDTVALKVTDPCIKAVFLKVTDTQLRNRLQQLFYNSFIKYGQEVNLTIIEVSQLNDKNGDPQIAASIRVKGNPHWTIQVNKSMISKVSNEFYGMAILHELVHSYMLYYRESKPLNLNDPSMHAEMFLEWVNQLKLAAKEIFGLSEKDATAIALTGMDDVLTQEDGNGGAFFKDKFDNFANTYYGTHLFDARQIADKYESGQLGTKCQ